MEESKKKFYEKAWFMWVTIFLFCPLGIFLMWYYKRYSKIARGVITVIFGFIFIAAIIPSNSSNNVNNKDITQVSTKTDEKAKEENKMQEQLNFNGDLKLSVGGNKVIATINANVPDGGLFEVSIMTSKLDVQSAVLPIKSGKIIKEFTIPKKWGVCEIAGTALFRFNLKKYPQPKNIKDIYGVNGEKMAGNMAKENNLKGKNGMLNTVTIDYPSKAAVAREKDKLFNKAIKELIKASSGIIVSINPYNDGSWDMVKVEVSDSWYYSQDYEKERFAETAGNSIETILKNTGKVSSDKTVSIFFYDTYGKELASPKVLGGYKIKG